MSAPRFTFDPAALCRRPLVRRGYCAVVAGLAVFLLTLVLLREPFHGYLAEVRVSGPAATALDLDEARAWLKAADEQVVVVPVGAAPDRPQVAIRMTCVARRADEATSRLDDLAARWLAQYLPDRLQAQRRTALRDARQITAAARQREDDARLRVDRLRQEQLADLLERRSLHSDAAPPTNSATARPLPGDLVSLRQRLETLHAELNELLWRCTEAHPDVIRLRAQIAGLEEQLRRATSGHTPPAAPRSGPEALGAVPARQVSAERQRPSRDWAAELEAALRELSLASAERQAAELRASDVMQSLSSLPTAADWSAQPAWVVTRIGGTPRTATIGLAGLLAALAAAGMFAAAGCIATPKIETAHDLAAALEIPVIGGAAAVSSAGRVRRLCTPQRVMFVVRGAEAVVILAVAACLLAIAIEPALARQVVADPFGTLSEVIGRFS